MATFTERISVVIDAKYDGFSAGLKKIKTDIASAEGAVGKFKAGAKGLGDGLGNLMSSGAGLPIIGGYLAGLFKVSTDAADAFSNLAKESIDLAAATGLSAEEASRWIAVADDFGLTASELQLGLQRIGKDLDKDKWEKYGIATRDAAGQARGANAIFLDALDVLNNTKNATERARLGNELFGKGYASLAPIIGKTRSEYEKMLGAVSEGQTITADEAEKAEEWRLAQDALADSMRDIQLELGKLVVELAPLIKSVSGFTSGALSTWIEQMERAEQTIADVKATVLTLSYNVQNVMGPVLEELVPNLDELTKGFDAAHDAGDRGADGISYLTEVTDDLTEATKKNTPTTREMKEALGGVATAAAAADRELSDLKGNIDDEQAWLNMLDTLDAYKEKQDDATASDREKRQAGLAIQEELVDRLAAIENLPAEVQTEIITLINQGDYDMAAWKIGVLTSERKIKIKFDVGNMPTLPGTKYASGTKSAKPGFALVGEQGPEIVLMGGGEEVLTASETSRARSGGMRGGLGGGNTYLTVNVPNADPNQVVKIIKEHMRRNGGSL